MIIKSPSKTKYINCAVQIDSSTIGGNVEFAHSQYSDVTSVNSVFVSDKTINYSDYFRIKCLFYSKISAILCVI